MAVDNCNSKDAVSNINDVVTITIAAVLPEFIRVEIFFFAGKSSVVSPDSVNAYIITARPDLVVAIATDNVLGTREVVTSFDDIVAAVSSP